MKHTPNSSSYGTILVDNFKEEPDEINDMMLRQKRCACISMVLILCLVVFIATILFVSISSPNSSRYISTVLLSFTYINSYKSTSTHTKPNFIIIIADDLSWNSVGYTSSDIAFATPHLSSLAKQGIIMDNFYAQEVCSPSRASLLTGRYPLSIGMQYGMVSAIAEWGMPLGETTLPEVLKDNSYMTHMLGKWHLGYFSPVFLPTARGFDSWTGYSNGENYYWSKKSPDYDAHSDFIESNTTCYTPYTGSDKHNYSTIFYTNKAINIIENHDTSDPLFLYMAYQAVHDPFIDHGKFDNGIPDSYFDEDPSVLETIHKTIIGDTRQEYVKSLYLLDKGIGQLYDALTNKGIVENTYIIFMSDNGGCWYGGGRNGPLRGSKGALFDGGMKVDSFIYSPLLSNGGTNYTGLMHISDWFPTILALANIEYTPSDDYKLDGINQLDGWKGTSTPRTVLLYNMYIDITDYNFNIWYNGSFAIRDEKYKLMHTYDDPDYGDWFYPDTTLDDDSIDNENRCAQQFVKGVFTYWLFDLVNDPYETTNIYDSENQLHKLAKQKLYSYIPIFKERATKKKAIVFSEKAEIVWKENGNNMIPWANTESLENSDYSYPGLCS
jgi:arylsulfatase A-like enzyme